MRHDRDESAARRQVREVGHAACACRRRAPQRVDLLVRQLQELIEQAELVHELQVEGWIVSPRKSRRKSACLSSTTVLTPARANRNPSIIPAGPPPAMQHVACHAFKSLSRCAGGPLESQPVAEPHRRQSAGSAIALLGRVARERHPALSMPGGDRRLDAQFGPGLRRRDPSAGQGSSISAVMRGWSAPKYTASAPVTEWQPSAMFAPHRRHRASRSSAGDRAILFAAG